MMEQPSVNGQFILKKYPGKGGWTYVLIPRVFTGKAAAFGWITVSGSIDGLPVNNYRIMPKDEDNLFLPIKATIRKITNKKEGDYINVILYEDSSPAAIPDELKLCLLDEPVAYEAFLACSEIEKKAFIDWIYDAKKPDTRIERIARMLQQLNHQHGPNVRLL